MKTIFVLGSLNTDLSITTNQIPTEGQTVAGSNFKTGCGGKGLNQAIAAAKLGAKVKFLGAVGDDLFGRQMVDALKHQKVDVKNVKILPKISSGIAVILLNNNNNRIVLDLGANLTIKKTDVDAFLKDAKEGDVFVAQLENNLDAVSYGLEVAKNKKMITVLNPAPANTEIEKSLFFCDYFLPNETEFEIFKDKLGDVKNLIVTLGKDGYKFISKEQSFEGKAPFVKVADTTGAGDCFVGAFSYMLAKGEKIDKNTMDFVTKIASISTTRFGSSISSPTMDEVLKFN